MRVGVLSYPMLFQRTGGLQVQILETIRALRALKIEIELISGHEQRLADFDLIHIFSVINGNHRIVEAVKAAQRSLVVSPLLRPFWNRAATRKARFIDRCVGWATRWEVQTSFGEISKSLCASDHLIALGETEKSVMVEAFSVPTAKVTVIPNGVDERFFRATPDAFAAATGIAPGFVLNVASVNSHKNQRALVEAMEGSSRQVVLIGPVEPADRAYLANLQTRNNVRYVGVLSHEDPLLASAYAAAAVFVLPSHDEVMPLTVLESLAAGRPVVMTKNHCMTLKDVTNVVNQVDPCDIAAIRQATLGFLDRSPSSEACKSAVKAYRWDTVAQHLLACYQQVSRQTALAA